MRPVMRELWPYGSLKDGSVDLADVALMNDAIDAELENQFRAREAMKD